MGVATKKEMTYLSTNYNLFSVHAIKNLGQ